MAGRLDGAYPVWVSNYVPVGSRRAVSSDEQSELIEIQRGPLLSAALGACGFDQDHIRHHQWHQRIFALLAVWPGFAGPDLSVSLGGEELCPTGLFSGRLFKERDLGHVINQGIECHKLGKFCLGCVAEF